MLQVSGIDRGMINLKLDVLELSQAKVRMHVISTQKIPELMG